MQYKGFIASFHYVGDIGHFVGEIIHSNDTISFSATTFKALQETMIAAVDNYLNRANDVKVLASEFTNFSF